MFVWCSVSADPWALVWLQLDRAHVAGTWQQQRVGIPVGAVCCGLWLHEDTTLYAGRLRASQSAPSVSDTMHTCSLTSRRLRTTSCQVHCGCSGSAWSSSTGQLAHCRMDVFCDVGIWWNIAVTWWEQEFTPSWRYILPWFSYVADILFLPGKVTWQKQVSPLHCRWLLVWFSLYGRHFDAARRGLRYKWRQHDDMQKNLHKFYSKDKALFCVNWKFYKRSSCI